jgi:hypothetical protein
MSVRYLFIQTPENSLNSAQPAISWRYWLRDEAIVGVTASLSLYTLCHFLQPLPSRSSV